MTEAPTRKDCDVCGNEIPIKAIFCTHCQNYQNGHKPRGVSSAFMSGIVAIVAVLVSAVGPIGEMLKAPPNSEITAVPSGYRQITVGNAGEIEGTVHSISFLMTSPTDAEIQFAGGGAVGELKNLRLGPGETQTISFEPVFLPDISPEALSTAICSLTVRTTSGRSEPKAFPFDTSCLSLIRTNSTHYDKDTGLMVTTIPVPTPQEPSVEQPDSPAPQ